MSDRQWRDHYGIPVHVSNGQICQDPSWVSEPDQPQCYSAASGYVFLDGVSQEAHTYAFVLFWFYHDGQDPSAEDVPSDAPTNADLLRAKLDLQAAISGVYDVTEYIAAQLQTKIQVGVDYYGAPIYEQAGTMLSRVDERVRDIQSDVSGTADKITGVLGQTLTDVVSAVDFAGSQVQGQLTTETDRVTKKIGDKSDDIVNSIGANALGVEQSVNGVASTIQGQLGSTLDSVVSSVNAAGTTITTGIQSTLDTLIPTLGDALVNNAAAIQRFLDQQLANAVSATDIAGSIIHGIGQRYDTLKDRVKETFQISLPPALKDAIDLIEGDLPADVKGAYRDIAQRYDWPPLIKGVLQAITTDEHAGGFFTSLLGFGALVNVVMDTVGGPLLRDSQYGFELALKTKQPGFREAIKAYQRRLIDRQRLDFLGGIEGYNADAIALLSDISSDTLTPLEYVRLYRRGLLDENSLRANIAASGLHPNQMTMLLQATEYIPTTQDVLVWLVRDVFRPDTREAFGMDLDFPVDALPYFSAQGISEQNARNFWAAHWEIPSIQQSFEMYQRTTTDASIASSDTIVLPDGSQVARIISRDEIERLQRTHDVEPFWRAKQRAVAFNPFTRVDLRRMHKLGVLTESGVFRGYLDIGYDEEKARLLTQFTLDLNRQEVNAETLPWRTALKAKVMSAYEAGSIDDAETREHLDVLGFTAAQIGFFLQESAFTQTLAAQKGIETAVKKLTVSHLWTNEQATAELSAYGLPDAQIGILLDTWGLEAFYADQEAALKHNKDLTKAEVETAYSEQAITRDEALAMLAALGYDERESGLLLAQIDYRVVKEQRKEVQDAVKALYLDGQIERPEAARRLDSINLPSIQRDALLDLWSVTRETKRPHLTLAHLEKMVATSLIDHDRANTELLKQHYTTDQASLLLALWGDEIAKEQREALRIEAARQATEARRVADEARATASRVNPPRVQLSQKQIADALSANVLTQFDARVQLLLNRVLPADVERILQTWTGTDYRAPAVPLATIESEWRRIAGENAINLRADPFGVEAELRRILGG